MKASQIDPDLLLALPGWMNRIGALHEPVSMYKPTLIAINSIAIDITNSHSCQRKLDFGVMMLLSILSISIYFESTHIDCDLPMES